MIVRELISILSQLNEDDLVCVSGYEGGYEDCINVEETEICLNVSKSDYYGPHEKTDNVAVGLRKKFEKRNAIIIL